MGSELSHGKARTTLTRSSDLQSVPAEAERPVNHAADGRWAPGNSGGAGRGWKVAIAKLLGRDISDPVVQAVVKDSWRIYCADVREMPSQGRQVRGLLALKARHEALAGFWSAQAMAHGLTSVEALAADERATKHGQRAERLAVTALDIATRMATRPSSPADFAKAVQEADRKAIEAGNARRERERAEQERKRLEREGQQ